MRGAALLAVVVALPLLVGWALPGPGRPWRDELAGAAGLLGLAALLLAFPLSGRIRLVTDRIGMDRTMRWHQLLGWIAAALLLAVHPFLYTLPDGVAVQRPDDLGRLGALGLSGGAVVTGLLGWLLLGVLAASATRRDDMPWRYEAWRSLHLLFGVAAAGLGMHHALHAGRYSAAPEVAALWWALLLLALGSVAWARLARPLRLARRPWRVAGLRPLAERIWEVELAPEGHPGLAFRAGQFAWLKFDAGPFARREHPFSIASAPGEPGARLRFAIKEAGDFTGRIGALRPGARAFVDGPHGNLGAGCEAAPGLAFLCGGVGVAPALSMIRAEAARPSPRPMLLLYGNRRLTQAIAAEELARLPTVETVHVLGEPPPGWTGEAGLLDAEVIARRCGPAARAGWSFVLCGPPPMLWAARRALRGLGVPAARIREERFRYG
jgi:predicted ferric reductase